MASSSEKVTTISREKAADIEFSYVAGEMRARTEFNRRVQNLQITLLTSLFVAPLVASFTNVSSTKLEAIFLGDTAALVSFAVLGVMIVNFVMLLEVEQNGIYILMTAGYFDMILTRKYELENSCPAFEYAFWVNMLSRRAKSLFERNVFLLSAHIFLSVTILFISSVIFVLHQFLSQMPLVYRLVEYAFFLTIIALYAYVFQRELMSVRKLKSFISSEEVLKFEERYPVVRERLGENLS